MLRSVLFAGAGMLLAASYGGAQVSRGVAAAPGITVHAPPPPPPATVLPQQPPSGRYPSHAAASGDLFVARPDTYAPQFDRRHSRHRSRHLRTTTRALFPYAAEVNGFFVGLAADVNGAMLLEPGLDRAGVDPEGFEHAAADVRADEAARVAASPERASLERAQIAAADRIASAVAPAAAKTLYVIPRCYAGDRRPLAADLPAGCSLADLRVISPGTR